MVFADQVVEYDFYLGFGEAESDAHVLSAAEGDVAVGVALVLGAFGALFAMRGLGVEFWGWVLPHGITELFAVILCGGAGLVLGQALVFPGTHARLDNLAIKGREAGVIALGCVAMFFVAGLLEGFFRQIVNDTFVRYVVAGVSALLLYLYFTRCGREEALG